MRYPNVLVEPELVMTALSVVLALIVPVTAKRIAAAPSHRLKCAEAMWDFPSPSGRRSPCER